MTGKKAVKVRDADRTKTLQLAAVGELVREKGFPALTATAISRIANRHPSSVSRMFGSLNGLLSAYIDQKDYWGSFFASFVPKGDEEEEMKQLFTELMQENFKSFWQDREMQQLIAYQMTAKDKLMRSVSDKRELEGGKLLGLTDRHFAGTGTSFRMVMALLLYGSYGMVLHARNNGSTVCGVDINNEREWQMLHRTITQVIGWAWEHKNQPEDKPDKKQAKLTMNYEFETLESLAEERAAGFELEAAEGSQPVADPRIATEVKRLKRLVKRHLISMYNETQIRTYLQINLHTLVMICDLLTVAGRPLNPDAELVLDLLECIRQDMNAYIPENLAVPVLIVQRESGQLAASWEAISKRLRRAGIDEQLIYLTGSPFRRFLSGAQVQWASYRYLRMYARGLEEMPETGLEDDQALLQVLLQLGLNSSRFINHYVMILEAGLKIARPEQQAVLKLQRAAVMQHRQVIDLRYHRFRAPADVQLLQWMDAQQGKMTDTNEQLNTVIELMSELLRDR